MGIKVGVIRSLPKSDSLELVERYISNGVKHLTWIEDLDENMFTTWLPLFKATCNRIFWILLLEQRNLPSILNFNITEVCRSSTYMLVLENNNATKSVVDAFTVYVPEHSSTEIILNPLKTLQDQKWRKRPLNLKGISFRLALILMPPMVMKARYGNRKFTGSDAYVIYALQEKFQFGINFVSPTEGKVTGERLENGSYNGIMGLVQRKEADFTICSLNMYYDRSLAADFSVPLFLEGTGLISLIPEFKSKVYVIVRPFTLELWLLMALVALAMYIMIKLAFYVKSVKRRGKRSDIGWTVFKAFLNKGFCERKFPYTMIKFLLAIWVAYAFIMTTTYGGTLVSLMAFNHRENAINTIDDLLKAAKNSNVSCGSYAQTGFSHKFMILLNQKKVSNDIKVHHFTSINQGLRIVYKENYALYFQLRLTKIRAKTLGMHRFLHYGEALATDYGAITFKKQFSYLKNFNRMLRHFFEMGLIDHWKMLAEHEYIDASGPANTSFLENKTLSSRKLDDSSVLGLDELKGPFLFFLCGHMVATIVLMLEVIVHKIIHK